MKALRNLRLWLLSLLTVLVLTLGAPGRAQEPASDGVAAWQAVISSQIQAFRDHDAPTAFDLASVGFQATFPNAETFFVAIIRSGYAPIADSRSHSFGTFKRLDESSVMQQVRFIGNDQTLYEAVYQVTEEPGGWRVQGVHLTQPFGVAV